MIAAPMSASDGLVARITMPVGPFFYIAGIGRTKFYELLKNNEIKTVLVGRRLLVVVQSWYDYIERQCAAEANQ